MRDGVVSTEGLHDGRRDIRMVDNAVRVVLLQRLDHGAVCLAHHGVVLSGRQGLVGDFPVLRPVVRTARPAETRGHLAYPVNTFWNDTLTIAVVPVVRRAEPQRPDEPSGLGPAFRLRRDLPRRREAFVERRHDEFPRIRRLLVRTKPHPAALGDRAGQALCPIGVRPLERPAERRKICARQRREPQLHGASGQRQQAAGHFLRLVTPHAGSERAHDVARFAYGRVPVVVTADVAGLPNQVEIRRRVVEPLPEPRPHRAGKSLAKIVPQRIELSRQLLDARLHRLLERHDEQREKMRGRH